MATNTVRIDDSVRDETVEIASRLGLTFNSVVNILLRKFNAEKGFFFPLTLEKTKEKSVFAMNSEEFEAACRKAVSERTAVPTHEYVTLLDEETGQLIKKYDDGRIVYVIEQP